jgi:hypothetical protein
MTGKNEVIPFSMTAPREIGQSSRYAFWFRTEQRRLVGVVGAMNCVVALRRSRSTGRIMVEIDGDHDPDEAWHWIRTELEQAVNHIELDDIWVNAIRWIL